MSQVRLTALQHLQPEEEAPPEEGASRLDWEAVGGAPPEEAPPEEAPGCQPEAFGEEEAPGCQPEAFGEEGSATRQQKIKAEWDRAQSEERAAARKALQVDADALKLKEADASAPPGGQPAEEAPAPEPEEALGPPQPEEWPPADAAVPRPEHAALLLLAEFCQRVGLASIDDLSGPWSALHYIVEGIKTGKEPLALLDAFLAHPSAGDLVNVPTRGKQPPANTALHLASKAPTQARRNLAIVNTIRIITTFLITCGTSVSSSVICNNCQYAPCHHQD